MTAEQSRDDGTGAGRATETSPEPRSIRPGWMSRIPAHVPGGFRTTTVAMVVVFLFVLILWNNVRFDPTMNENSPVYTPPPPTTSEVIPEQTFEPTTTLPPSTTRSTTPPVTTTGGTAPQDEASTSGSPTSTPVTTTPAVPGFQLPALPGFPPAQAPN